MSAVWQWLDSLSPRAARWLALSFDLAFWLSLYAIGARFDQ